MFQRPVVSSSDANSSLVTDPGWGHPGWGMVRHNARANSTAVPQPTALPDLSKTICERKLQMKCSEMK